MRKLTLVLGLVGLMAAAGCRADGSDITGAATSLAEQEKASQFRRAIGEYLVYLLSDSRTEQTGQVETDGTFGADSTDPQTFEFERVTVQKVMKKTFVEPANVNGFVVNEISQQTKDVYKQGNTTIDSGESRPERSERVLFEIQDWVRSIGTTTADEDETLGDAMYPVRPRPGLYYVDDDGNTLEAKNETEVVNGVKGVKVVSHQASQPLPIEKFFEYCYETVAAASMTQGNVDVQPLAAHNCFGLGSLFGSAPNVVFTLSAIYYTYIGQQLQLLSMLMGEEIQIDQIHCGNNRAAPTASTNIGGTLSDCAAGDEVYFTGTKTTYEEKAELAKAPEIAEDKEALPQIEDAAEVLD